jgi:tRNA A37 methylthiotransferase MiaB
MKNKVEPKIIKQRAQILRKVGDELGRKFVEQFVGQTCEVLIEDAEPTSGRCERYFIVKVECKNEKVKSKNEKVKMKNEIILVKITAATSEGAVAEAASSKSAGDEQALNSKSETNTNVQN